MANFKLDVDADGIALVTGTCPTRSMNVITMGASRNSARWSRKSRAMPP